MNGEIGQVFEVVNRIDRKVSILETTQTINHEQNQKDIGRLYKWMFALSILILSASVTVTVTAIAG